MRLPRTCTSDLYLKREPMRMNPERAEFFWTGPLSLKKAWCSTAHFHRCLQALGWSILKTKVCSCSFPCGRRRRRCRSERNVIACSSRPPPDRRLRQRNQRADKEDLTGFNICLSSRIDRHIVKTRGFNIISTALKIQIDTTSLTHNSLQTGRVNTSRCVRTLSH